MGTTMLICGARKFIKSFSCAVIGRRTSSRKTSSQVQLVEVGQFDSPKLVGEYETGQLFMHKVFAYRGVVLFPWTARVYDRDTPKEPEETAASATVTTTAKDENDKNDKGDAAAAQSNANKNAASDNLSKDFKGKLQTFYQVLVDARDCPYIRAQTESVTFLGNSDSNRSLYVVPGLDYVAHEDIMPYTSRERQPLMHELCEKFLMHSADKNPPFEARDDLKSWQEKNQPWFELSDVHRETTENVRVTVIPFYMGCRETPLSSVYWWRYCIRLENMGDLSVQLRESHWRIFSLSGTLETVRGRGVVGQEPVLSPRLRAFQYTSHVTLQAPSGHMWGTFRLEREDGFNFDCKIPPVSLESQPEEDSTPTTNTPSTGSPGPDTSSTSKTNTDLD